MTGGSGSDGEATGGEMSDGQPKKKKIKLIPSSSKGTPAGSRAGSPLPAPASGKFIILSTRTQTLQMDICIPTMSHPMTITSLTKNLRVFRRIACEGWTAYCVI